VTPEEHCSNQIASFFKDLFELRHDIQVAPLRLDSSNKIEFLSVTTPDSPQEKYLNSDLASESIEKLKRIFEASLDATNTKSNLSQVLTQKTRITENGKA
jgi:hypothetical protein